MSDRMTDASLLLPLLETTKYIRLAQSITGNQRIILDDELQRIRPVDQALDQDLIALNGILTTIDCLAVEIDYKL